MGSGPGNIYESGNNAVSKDIASSDKPAEGSTSKRCGKRAPAKGSLEANVESVRKEFELHKDGFLGSPGNKGGIREIASDNPAQDAKRLYELLSRDGVEGQISGGKGLKIRLADGTCINFRVETGTPDSPAVQISRSTITALKDQKVHFFKKG